MWGARLLPWRKGKLPVDHPQRLGELQKALGGLQWDSASRRASASRAFDAVEALALAEHGYYYSRRHVSRMISVVTRLGGWIFGTIGVLIPLVAATDPARKEWAAWGFVALAAAGACFSANALFAATASHISYVKAQLTIEHLIVEKRLGWTQIVAVALDNHMENGELAARFQYLQEYMGSLAKIVDEETSQWQKVIIDELAKVNKPGVGGK